MEELYASLIKMQDHAILSADKADSLGLDDLACCINRFIGEAGKFIEEIAPNGVVKQ